MRILLIMPDAHMHKMRIGFHVRSMREAPLTLSTLAALVQDADIEWKLVDGSIGDIPLDENADLIGISVITGTANAAYRIADHYRSRNIPVVLGGIHVTLLPSEASAHADAIVVGMAERTWPQLIADFRAGRMKKTYEETASESDILKNVPIPRRDLMRRNGYMMPDVVQATRGCKRTCDFCTVPAIWPRYYRRPVSDVIDDVRSLPGNRFVFNDVSLVDDREYAMELFNALSPLKKKWGGLTTIEVAGDHELLGLMERSGCIYLLIGFESINRENLRQIYKGFNHVDNYSVAMETLHSHNISVQGCFVFGLDHDDRSVFESTVQRVNELKIDIPRYSLYTPYPGTMLFKRLFDEGRILSFNWDDYDTMHAVIRPAQMNPFELYDGFKWAYKETFRFKNAVRRLRLPVENSVINMFGAMTYRKFARRLYNEKRFSTPYSLEAPGEAPLPGQIRFKELGLCPV